MGSNAYEKRLCCWRFASAFTLLCNYVESGHAILRQILTANHELLNKVAMHYLENPHELSKRLSGSDEGALIIDMLESQANQVTQLEAAVHTELRFFKPIRSEKPDLNVKNDQAIIPRDRLRLE